MEGLLACATDLKQLAKKLDERQRQYQEMERQREAAAQKEALELNNRKKLENQAQQWVRCLHLGEFINACEKQMLHSRADGLPADSWEAQWLVWARAHAERLNPLCNGFLEKKKAEAYGIEESTP